MQCGQCGKEIDDGSKFCKFCGNRLDAGVPRPGHEPMECEWCDGHGVNPLSGGRCSVCGGRGTVFVKQAPKRCTKCLGSGREGLFALSKCSKCNGWGWEGVDL
jgi:hypothetical protein